MVATFRTFKCETIIYPSFSTVFNLKVKKRIYFVIPLTVPLHLNFCELTVNGISFISPSNATSLLYVCFEMAVCLLILRSFFCLFATRPYSANLELVPRHFKDGKHVSDLPQYVTRGEDERLLGMKL